ncbi:hypothetical protein [Desulfovibrio sp.]|uniref:hypothetical protein n=1 Tax=Desulfovibrio sp. TaxID=885 RepID=UPI0025BC8735|nr:hypothetical protein [Desulfovibrio sp.]
MPSSTFFDSCSAIDIDLASLTCNGPECHYICKATLKTGTGRTVSALGEADTLQAASDRSRANATRLLQSGMPDAQTEAYSRQHTVQTPERPQDKAVYNGGGSKPASTKQIDLAQQIAQEKGLSAERQSNKTFGKALARLTGSEINTLIRTLKDR